MGDSPNCPAELKDEDSICELCMSTPPLRDELYLQVAKQLTSNNSA